MEDLSAFTFGSDRTLHSSHPAQSCLSQVAVLVVYRPHGGIISIRGSSMEYSLFVDPGYSVPTFDRAPSSEQCLYRRSRSPCCKVMAHT